MIGILIAGLWSCREYEPPTAEYAFPYMTNNINYSRVVNIQDSATLWDLSRGVINRQWSFSKKIDYVTGDNVSEKIVIRFMESGDCRVNLKCDFFDPSVNLDMTFFVSVLDSVKADFTLSYNDNINVGHNQQVSFDAGTTVTFKSISTGNPTNYEWLLPGSMEKEIQTTASSVTADYLTPGMYDARLIAYRTTPKGRDTLVLKNFIEVKRVIIPAQVQSIEQDEEDRLVLRFNIPMNAPTFANKDQFTVTRNGVNVPIVSLTKHATQSTFYIMEIEGGVWNGDDVKVSYANPGAGGVTSEMDTDLVDFVDFAFTPLNKNLIVNPGFESGLQWNLIYNTTTWGILENCGIRSNITHSGNYSCYFDNATPNGGLMFGANYSLNIKAGEKYYIEFWIYYTADPGGYHECRFEVESSSYAYPIRQYFVLTDIPRNQWVKMSGTATASTDNTEQSSAGIRFISGFRGYVDDYLMYRVKKHD